MAEYERKCKNWVQSFADWVLPQNAEIPLSFITWGAIFAVASALRRKVKIPRTIMGSWEVSPNFYIFFIGQAGKVRKTTSGDLAYELLDEIPDITKAPDMPSKEALFTRITKSNDQSMCIWAPEWSEFVTKSGPEFYGFLTNMFDGKRKISADTISRQFEFAERPCINLLAATTPEWMAANIPESIIGGGFASRTVFLHEEKVRGRKLFYRTMVNERTDAAVTHEELAKIREDLVADLAHIANNVNGEVSITSEVEEYLDKGWYRKNADEWQKQENYKLSGFYERLPAHVLKLAIIMHVAYSDDLTLTITDVEMAIALMHEVEKGLPDVFQSIGKNPYTVDVKRIYKVIKESGAAGVDLRELRAKFAHAATPSVLDELINGIVQTGRVTMIVDSGKGITRLVASEHVRGAGKRADAPQSNGRAPIVDLSRRVYQSPAQQPQED